MKKVLIIFTILSLSYSCRLTVPDITPYIAVLFSLWPEEPYGLKYSDSTANYNVGQNIDDNIPTYYGVVKTFSVKPDLPSGLSFDSLTGIISGTPEIESVSSNYVVTASNDDGYTNTTISITVSNSNSETSDSSTTQNVCDMTRDEIIQPENWSLVQAYLQEQAALGQSGTETVDTSTITGLSGGTSGSILSTNSKIYGIPSGSSYVTIIDPSNTQI